MKGYSKMYNQGKEKQQNFDTTIIRPEVRDEEVQIRGKGLSPSRLKKIKKGLRTLHTLELMAITIYKFQITSEASDHNRQLIAAMSNEMTHYQDFQVKLFEYCFKPSITRWAYWIIGVIFGFSSRLRGRRAVLRMGIWVETKAVHHYAKLLSTIDWDNDTRKVIEKNQSDEYGHIQRWKKLLESRK